MAKLTKRAVDAFQGPNVKVPADRKKWKWLGDDEVPGFGLRVYGSGAKVFNLRYRTAEGRHRFQKIGDYGAMTVEQARDSARKAYVAIKEGADPQGLKEEARRVVADLQTVGELVDRWFTDYAEKRRRRPKDEGYRIAKHVKPALGRIRLEDVRPATLAAWHTAIGENTPIEANRCYELLRAAWRYAERLELIPEDAPRWSTLKDAITPYYEPDRDRYLDEEEVARVMTEVAKESDPQVRAAIPLLILTGLRKRELLHAKWSDVNVKRGEIVLPKTKSGKQQTRTLVPEALAILATIPRFDGSPYIFPSPVDPSKPRDDLKKPWHRIRARAKLPDVSIHDLRRTTGSLLVQRGVPIATIQKILGHQNPAITEVYARLAGRNEREGLGVLAGVVVPLMADAGLVDAAPPEPAVPELSDQLRALLDAVGDDPAALAAGLRGLVTVDWSQAVEA